MKVKNKIKITVNGKQIQVIPNFSMMSLIINLKIPLNKIAIELNKKIMELIITMKKKFYLIHVQEVLLDGKFTKEKMP